MLQKWVETCAENGIVQHSEDWRQQRGLTVGGSSIAVIQGINPYTDVVRMMRERVAATAFPSTIQTQWGNLFEEVIKRCVERDMRCTILGEDLFVMGRHKNTSYSPDGLAETVHGDGTRVVLFEFKCPYSRLPNGRVPEHYAAQVRMGLDIIDIADVGMYVEAVFRRCCFGDLGNNARYDQTLVAKKSGTKVRYWGMIGFWTTPGATTTWLARYIDHFGEAGTHENEFMCNDLGDAPVELFCDIMQAVDAGAIKTWFGPLACPETPDAQAQDMLDAFREHCAHNAHVCVGVLPWKLFRMDYHEITRVDNYLVPWLDQINDFVDSCRAIQEAPMEMRDALVNRYADKHSPFDDV